jgi:hypothetical protein
MKNPVLIEFQYPIVILDNRKQPQHFDDFNVTAFVYLYRDGSIRTVDIETIKWGAVEVHTLIQATNKDLYNEIETAARVCAEDTQTIETV